MDERLGTETVDSLLNLKKEELQNTLDMLMTLINAGVNANEPIAIEMKKEILNRI